MTLIFREGTISMGVRIGIMGCGPVAEAIHLPATVNEQGL